MPESIRVEFEQLAQPPFPDLPIRVTVSGPFTRRGGAEVSARVGRQTVEAIAFRADGRGFTGYVHERPTSGDELVLQRGDFVVSTGARFAAPVAAAHSLSGDAALVASVPHARTRSLSVDVARGTQRFDAQDALVSARSLERSWIIEEPSLTPDARCFKPSTHDKTCRVTLAVRVPRLPAGGSIRWSVPPANRGSLTLSGNPRTVTSVAVGERADVIGLVPGLTFLDVEALDASGHRLESIKFPICVPQFVLVEDSGLASQGALESFHLGMEKPDVFSVAKEVVDKVLAKANVRAVWTMPPFSERLPPQFATGGIAASRVTIATIAGDPPRPNLLGETSPPAGPAVFNELIDVWPGAFADPVSTGAVEEVDDMTRAAVASIASMTNMSSREKNDVIMLIGRLIGETLSHEIGHSLVGATLGPTGHDVHNPAAGSPGALPHSLMNRGHDRSLTDRTGITPVASPISMQDVIVHGIETINVPTGPAQVQIDAHFPVPPVFA